MMKSLGLFTYTCLRCEYEWTPNKIGRMKYPDSCPSCNSKNWRYPKKFLVKKAGKPYVMFEFNKLTNIIGHVRTMSVSNLERINNNS